MFRWFLSLLVLKKKYREENIAKMTIRARRICEIKSDNSRDPAPPERTGPSFKITPDKQEIITPAIKNNIMNFISLKFNGLDNPIIIGKIKSGSLIFNSASPNNKSEVPAIHNRYTK